MSRRHTDVEPEAGRVSWGPLAAVLMTVVVYFASQVLAGLVISLYPVVSGWDDARLQEWAGTNNAQFITFVLVEAISLWLLWRFLKARRAKPADIGLVRPRSSDAWEVLKGYAIYFVALIFIMQAVGQFVPGLNLEQEQELGFDKVTTGAALAPIFISLVLLPPLVEEILFRGFLYTGLRRKLPVLAAALITGALFAVVHLQLGSGNSPLWAAALDTFILSFVLVGLREKTGSLWPSIGVHMLKNATAFLFLFVFI